MKYLTYTIYVLMSLRIDFIDAQTVEYPQLPEQIEEMDENEAERVYELVYSEVKSVDINRTTVVQLLDIPNMTEEMAVSIISFRDSTGYFLSIYELMSVPGITSEYLRSIAPWLSFVSTDNPGGSHLLSFRMVAKGTLTPEDVSGSNKQVGSAHKIAIRYKGEYRNLTLGIKAEKDAGEPFGGEYRPEGFDFYSGYFRYRGKGFIRQAIAGDYRIAAGHGLLCNQLFAAGNNASALYQPHEFRDARPHTSMDEHYFFRGVTITLKYRPFQLTLFGSLKPLDGNITETDSTNSRTLAVSSIQKSGIHSTLSEIEDRYAFREFAWGGILRYQHKKFQVGVNILHISYDAEIKPTETFANRNKFRGNTITGSSLTVGWYNHKTGFTSEIALSEGLPAISLVMVAKINDNTTLWISGRHLAPNYHAPYANTLSRSSTPSGEEGFNLVVAYSPWYGRIIRAVADMGRNFSTGNAPVSGRVFRIVSLEASGQGSIVNSLLRISYDNREEMQTSFPAEDPESTAPFFTNKWVARATMLISSSEVIKFYLRADYTYMTGQSAKEGWLMVAGAESHLFKNRLSISLRHYIVKTDHYDVRIYTHEQDAPGAFGMNILYGRGTRTYILVGLKPLRNIRVWLKTGYSSTEKPGVYQETTSKYDLGFQINITL